MSHRILAAAWVVLAWAGAAPAAGATTPDQDKSRFHLFNPTPRPLMREMSADRPDTTESPYTVDAGHVQVELSFLEFTQDRRGAADSEQWTILPSNLKVGLLNNADLQLVIEPYVRVESGHQPGADGFGDLQLRLKVNLWGNDGGATALAVMPFVQFPTSAEGVGADEVEGGLIVPFSVALGEHIGLTLMAEVDFIHDAADDDYDLELLHTASLGFELVGRLGGYAEYIGVARFDGDEDRYVPSLGVGLTYGVSDDVQLDVGFTVGLSEEAEDFRLFSGVTFRI